MGNLAEIFKRFRYALAAGAVVMAAGLLMLHNLVVRAAVVSELKAEILRLEKSLNEAGYDLAYNEISFSKIPFFEVAAVRGLKLYSLGGDGYVEWSVPALSIHAGLFDASSLSLRFARDQIVKAGGKTYNIKLSSMFADFDFAAGGLRELNAAAKGVRFGNAAEIGRFSLASQRMASADLGNVAPSYESFLEAADVKFLAGAAGAAIAPNLELFSLHSTLNGDMVDSDSYVRSFEGWAKRGGLLDIRRLQLNWGYLNLVAKGEITFADGFKPRLHLNTSSKGLLKAMEHWQENGLLDNKGAFVAKILLDNKSFKFKEDDVYKTVTTPINYANGQVTVENIVVKKFY